jgi:S-adenosylmethionine hydrolase
VPPVITLTTDFGDAGPFVAVMKAVIRQHAPDAPIADLTHRVPPFRHAEAGFWLARCYAYYPAGSVHVVVVDPGVGTARAILACAFDGHAFVAPDDGTLPGIVGTGASLHALAPDWPGRRDWPAPSNTFHGRDVFAPLAAMLWSGRAKPADIGPAARDPVPSPIAPPSVTPDGVAGTVVAIDTWGNLITNIEGASIAHLREPRVSAGHRELRLVATYGAAPPGALVALVNSFGTVEIAWREGNAAQMLNLGHGAPVTVR